MNIRNVNIDDAERITDIYNYYIKNTIITFETEELTVNDIEKRIIEITKTYPYIVHENDDGKVIGYAYASKFKEREAYKYSAELSIYYDQNEMGKGYGKVLFRELIKCIKNTDIRVLIGGIALPNDPRVRLHENNNFRKVAHFEKVGYKLNKWIDVGYWELQIKEME